MIIKRLKNHKYAQAYIMVDKEKEYLISYSTAVLIINRVTNIMEVTGLYSMTTRRHISWFLDEYYPHISYYTIKKAHEKGKNVDIEKGVLI